MALALVGLFLGALIIFVAGPYWLSYIAYRAILLHCARTSLKGRPALLFSLSVAASYVWLICTPAVAGMIEVLLNTESFRYSGLGELLLFIFLLSIPVGAIGWMVLAVSHFKRTARQRVYVLQHPPPKLQMWLQDLLIATFSLGFAMTVIVNLGQLIKEPGYIVGIAIYEIITQFVMFFAILDACRFSARLKVPRTRALYVFVMMFMNAFVPLPVLTLLAWNVWRRAMFLAEVEETPDWKRTTSWFSRPFSKMKTDVDKLNDRPV